VRTERVPFVAFGWLDGWSDAPPRWHRWLCGRQRGAISCSGFLAALPVSQLVVSLEWGFFGRGKSGASIQSVERGWQAAQPTATS